MLRPFKHHRATVWNLFEWSRPQRQRSEKYGATKAYRIAWIMFPLSRGLLLVSWNLWRPVTSPSMLLHNLDHEPFSTRDFRSKFVSGICSSSLPWPTPTRSRATSELGPFDHSASDWPLSQDLSTHSVLPQQASNPPPFETTLSSSTVMSPVEVNSSRQDPLRYDPQHTECVCNPRSCTGAFALTVSV